MEFSESRCPFYRQKSKMAAHCFTVGGLVDWLFNLVVGVSEMLRSHYIQFHVFDPTTCNFVKGLC